MAHTETEYRNAWAEHATQTIEQYVLMAEEFPRSYFDNAETAEFYRQAVEELTNREAAK